MVKAPSTRPLAVLIGTAQAAWKPASSASSRRRNGRLHPGFEREFAATLPERVPLDVSDQHMAPQVDRGGARTVADIDRQALFEFAPMRRNAPADHLGETLPVARQQTDGDREAAADRLDQVRDRLE